MRDIAAAQQLTENQVKAVIRRIRRRAKTLFEEDDQLQWIASLDNHMYHNRDTNTIQNTIIPEDTTGIVRK